MKRSCVARTFAACLLASLAVLATSHPAHARREVGLGATYDPRLPVGGLRTFTPDVALGGFQLKWDYFPLDRLSVGVEVQYHLFRRPLDTDTVAVPDGAVTGPNFRYAAFIGFLPTVRYYVTSGALQPYAEMGVGMATYTTSVLVSDLSQRSTTGAFIFQPSVGVLVRLWSSRTGASPLAVEEGPTPPPKRPLESMFGLTASLTYAFTTADVVTENNVGYGGFQIGIYAKP